MIYVLLRAEGREEGIIKLEPDQPPSNTEYWIFVIINEDKQSDWWGGRVKHQADLHN